MPGLRFNPLTAGAAFRCASIFMLYTHISWGHGVRRPGEARASFSASFLMLAGLGCTVTSVPYQASGGPKLGAAVRSVRKLSASRP